MNYCFRKKRGIEKKYVNYWFTLLGAYFSRKTDIAILDVVHCLFFWPSKALEGKYQCDQKGLRDTRAPDTHVQLLCILEDSGGKPKCIVQTWVLNNNAVHVQNFFCPLKLRREVLGWQICPLRLHASQSKTVLLIWLMKEVRHSTKGVLGEMRNIGLLSNTITSTKVQEALKQMYEE